MSTKRSSRQLVALRWAWLNWPGWSRRLATVLSFALVTWLMLAPAATFDDVQVFEYQDKIAHGVIFLALALLLRWSVPGEWGTGWAGVAVPSLLVLYAGSIEACQPLFTGSDRMFEWPDLASNLAGIGAGWALFQRLASEVRPTTGDCAGPHPRGEAL